MSSGKVTPAGRSLVMTRICGGCTTAGNRDRYTVSQCPWVKSRNMGRVAARSHDTAGLRIGRQPMFLQILAAPNNRHAILSVQAVLGAAIRTDRSRRAVCALERMSCGLAVLTIAHRTYDRRTNDLNGSLTALATGEATLLVFSHILVSL